MALAPPAHRARNRGRSIAAEPMNAELTFANDAALKDVGVLAHKAVAMDASALMRFRSRELPVAAVGAPSDNSAESAAAPVPTAQFTQVWVKTPFGPLASRTVELTTNPDDVIVTAAEMKEVARRAFAQARGSSADPGESLTSVTSLPYRLSAQPAVQWPGFLPVLQDWTVVDYVPASAFRTLERQARTVATESSGPMGLPTSLLNQNVLSVSATESATSHDAAASPTGLGDKGQQQLRPRSVEITMRDVFALCAMGFIPEEPEVKEPVRVSVKGRWRRLDGRFGSVFTMENLGVLPLLN